MYQQYSKLKKFVKYLDKTQIDTILDNARKVNKRDYLILLTLWKTGMRCNELTHLKKKDIKIDEITIRQGKGSKDRLIPIDTSLGDLLNLYAGDMTLEDILFPLSNAQVRNIVHKHQGELDVHPHTFRHSFSLHCLKSGMNLRSLQKILGHSNLDTTAIYLDIVADDIKNDYKKVHW